MDKATEVFKSYNDEIEDCYEKYIENNDGKEVLFRDEEKLGKFIKHEMERWADSPLPQLDGMTPSQYFDSIGDLEGIMELFEAGARICDYEIPEPLIKKLGEFGEDATGALLKLAGNEELYAGDEDVCVPVAAINVLGRWKQLSTLESLLTIFDKCSMEHEAILEAVSAAVANIGTGALRAVNNLIGNLPVIKGKEEYLVLAVKDIGKACRSDEVYGSLKNAFLKMENKALGAAILEEYGDGRAVALLRGFAQKNSGRMDRTTFYSIKTAVQKLGGNMDDIPFKQLR